LETLFFILYLQSGVDEAVVSYVFHSWRIPSQSLLATQLVLSLAAAAVVRAKDDVDYPRGECRSQRHHGEERVGRRGAR
jgi:hypothetical protein